MLRVTFALVGIVLMAIPAAAQTFKSPLISSSQNHPSPPLAAGQISGKDITPDCPIAWTVTMVSLHGGKQEGVQLIVIDNGKIKITVIPTRGLGVLSVTQGDVRLGWDSPVKEVVHPKHVNLQARAGLGWLEGFNEWMVRCGLENNGGPGTDKFINNLGDEGTLELTLHGKIANIPASEVELRVEKKAPYRITIKGRVDEKMLFGPKLELHTEISTEPGSSGFRIADVVTNAGSQPQEFQMLYHINFGSPLLEEGAKVLAPAERVTPFNANAARDVKAYSSYRGPTPGFVEQVYLYRPLADAAGKTTVLIHNKAADRAASMTYSLKELPYLTTWKCTGDVKDGYVTGIEPGTNYPNKRAVERKHGRVPVLAGGASYPMTIDYMIHVGEGEVRQVVDRIADIQKQKPIVVDGMP